MAKLIALCGPVGGGKSTLIEAFLKSQPEFKYHDIYQHIQKYKDASGHMEPAHSLKAHCDFYAQLERGEGSAVIEIGTNRAELNLQNLNRLRKGYDVHIIFCLLDAQTCIQRVMARAQESPDRTINAKDLEEKFKRAFPDEHVVLAKKFQLPFSQLDMSRPIDERVETLMSLVR